MQGGKRPGGGRQQGTMMPPPPLSPLVDMPSKLDESELAASPLFALGLCLDSSPLYYLAVAKRLQELHELSPSSDEDDETRPANNYKYRNYTRQSYLNNNAQRTHSVFSTKANENEVIALTCSPKIAQQETQNELAEEAVVDSYVEGDESGENKIDAANYFTTYRMSARTVEDLLRVLCGCGALSRNFSLDDGETKVDALKTLQAGLSYLGSQKPLDALAQELNLSTPAVVSRLVRSAIKALAAVAPQLIYWPNKRDAALRQADAMFANSFGLEGCIGILGWTQLTTDAAPVCLQAAVDHRLRFVDIACLDPLKTVSTDDTKNNASLLALFQKSSLYKKLDKPSDVLPVDCHILAPQLRSNTPLPVSWLVTRYSSQKAVPGEKVLAGKVFNRHVCHVASVTVQQTFRQTLRRFQRLNVLTANNNECGDMKTTVLAAAVLHNFCIDRKEPLPTLDNSTASSGDSLLKMPGYSKFFKVNASDTPSGSDTSEQEKPSSLSGKRTKIASAFMHEPLRSKRPKK